MRQLHQKQLSLLAKDREDEIQQLKELHQAQLLVVKKKQWVSCRLQISTMKYNTKISMDICVATCCVSVFRLPKGSPATLLLQGELLFDRVPARPLERSARRREAHGRLQEEAREPTDQKLKRDLYCLTCFLLYY